MEALVRAPSLHPSRRAMAALLGGTEASTGETTHYASSILRATKWIALSRMSILHQKLQLASTKQVDNVESSDVAAVAREDDARPLQRAAS